MAIIRICDLLSEPTLYAPVGISQIPIKYQLKHFAEDMHTAKLPIDYIGVYVGTKRVQGADTPYIANILYAYNQPTYIISYMKRLVN